MAPEGCYLDNLPASPYMNDLKAAADNTRTAKALFDLLGRGVGGDIKVLRFFAQQEVANGAAHDVSLEALIL